MSRASLAAAGVLVVAIHADFPLAPPARASAFARQDLPEGSGKSEVARLCAGCHDLTFTISTRETEADWTRIVNDMRSRGVDGTEEEFAKVIAYLTAHMGKAEPPAPNARLKLLASRTKVAPGERFALGLRLGAAAGWRLKDAASPRPPQVSWKTPQTIAISDPAAPVAEGPVTLTVFPAVVSTSATPGSALDLTARVTYEVCREICLTETATASVTLPVGDGGEAAHEEEFSRARAVR